MAPSQPRLRPARADDWQAIVATPAPAAWAGLVVASAHLIYGFGCVYEAVDGRWWVMFRRTPGVRMVKTAHTAARLLLGAAREAGVVVHALADARIGGAELWLRRLGFVATDERIEGVPVWVRR